MKTKGSRYVPGHNPTSTLDGAEVSGLRTAGMSIYDIAAHYDVNESTVYRVLSRHSKAMETSDSQSPAQ